MHPRGKRDARTVWAENGIEPRRLLVVEPGSFLADLARDIPHSGAMVLCHYARLSRALISRVTPDCVVAPLLSPAFDIFDLIRLLEETNYASDLLAVTPPLPNGRMVLRELRSGSRQMRLRLLEHDAGVFHWAGDQG